MTLKLPRIQAASPIADQNGVATPTMLRWWNELCKAIEANINSIASLLTQVESALGLAESASTTANNAAAAAGTLTTQAGGLLASIQINTSYVSGFSITATDAGASATVTIPNHTRVYGDGTSVAVTGAALTGLAYSTSFYVYYDQAARNGGTVAYQTAITIAAAGFSTVNPNRHYVGAVVTPAALGAAIKGIGAMPPGVDVPSGFTYA